MKSYCILAILSGLAGLVGIGIMAYAGGNQKTPPSQAYMDQIVLVTVAHDDHLFVVQYRGGVDHHPDCPCKKRK